MSPVEEGGNPSPQNLPPAKKAQTAEMMRVAMDQLRQEGVPEANLRSAAAILVGNAQSESGLNPNATHDHGTGFGLYGARLSRRDEMFSWLKSHGYPLNSAEGQMRYMAHEAMVGNSQQKYPATRNILMHATPETLRSDTNNVMREFEAPANKNQDRSNTSIPAYNTGPAKEAPPDATHLVPGVGKDNTFNPQLPDHTPPTSTPIPSPSSSNSSESTPIPSPSSSNSSESAQVLQSSGKPTEYKPIQSRIKMPDEGMDTPIDSLLTDMFEKSPVDLSNDVKSAPKFDKSLLNQPMLDDDEDADTYLYSHHEPGAIDPSFKSPPTIMPPTKPEPWDSNAEYAPAPQDSVEPTQTKSPPEDRSDPEADSGPIANNDAYVASSSDRSYNSPHMLNNSLGLFMIPVREFA
jgi:hypothetical protein